MKKITLLLALLITGITFGQIDQIKTQSQSSLICGSGNYGEINEPLNYSGSKSSKYTIGNSGINDTWTYNTQINDINNVYQKSEISFQNTIPNSAVTDILSITSVSGGGMTLSDYMLKISGPDGVTTGNDPFCPDGSGNTKKIRFSLVKLSNFTMGGDPIVVTLKASDLSTNPIYEETITMTFNQPAVLSTDNLNNFNFICGPNPASDVINVSAAKSIETVEIVNFSGQKVLQQKLNATNGAVDIANVAPGIYLMTVTINGSKETYKIIKE